METVLSEFLEYYQKRCELFINTHSKEFSGKYFGKWYQTECKETLEVIRSKLDGSRLDERVAGFVRLYRCYIDAALERENEDLLLDNLYAIPTEMKREFLSFGFLNSSESR